MHTERLFMKRNKLLNKREWEVTLEYEGQQAVVVINAYTGEFMEIYGLLN